MAPGTSEEIIPGLFTYKLFSFLENKKESRLVLKGMYIFLTKNQCPQIYIKLTQFEDYDGIKLPLKFYLLRCCSFWEMSKSNNFRLSFSM